MIYSRWHMVHVIYIYIRKRRGPNIDPWGTPQFMILRDDITPFSTWLISGWQVWGEPWVCSASNTIMIQFRQKNFVVDRIESLFEINEDTTGIHFLIKWWSYFSNAWFVKCCLRNWYWYKISDDFKKFSIRTYITLSI